MSAAAAPPSASTTAPSSTEDRPVVLRRLIARLIDDTWLAVLSGMIVLAMARTFGGSDDASAQAFAAELGGDDAPFTSYVPFGGGLSPAAIVLGVLLATAIFAGYSWIAALRDGRTLGRLAAGLCVAASDGSPATPRLIFGRELLRVALICAALAFLAPAAAPITTAMAAVAAENFSTEVGQLSAALGAALPIGVVAAAWIGAALVDARQRAPHDRLSKTIVVRAR